MICYRKVPSPLLNNYNFHMRFYQTSLVLFLCCTATATFACQAPGPGDNYDVLSSQDTIVGIAKVLSVTSAQWGETGSCIIVNYSAIESYHGILPQSFKVETCFESISPDVNPKMISFGGYVTGATVFIGLVKLKSGQQKYRYAVISCWGPYHVRLDTFSKALKKKVIDDIKKGFSSSKD